MFRYRTSINFTGLPYNDSISHPKIIETYNYLLENYNILLEKCDYITIRINQDLEVYINFIKKSKVSCSDLIKNLLEPLVANEYNIYWNTTLLKGKEYIYEKFLIGSSEVEQYQHPYSFFQTYLEPRLEIYNYMNSIGFRKNLICFGGEFYIYSQIIPHSYLKCFTDCPDLFQDALYNYREFPIFHINYNSAKDLENILENPDLIIINTSRKGMKSQLAKKVKSIAKEIIYIGCKIDSLNRDLEFLNMNTIYYKNFSNNVYLVHLETKPL